MEHGSHPSSRASGMAALMCEKVDQLSLQRPTCELAFPHWFPGGVGWHNIEERRDSHPHHSGCHRLCRAHCVCACGCTNQSRVERRGHGCLGSWGARAKTFSQQESGFRSRSSGSSQGASGERMSSRCDLLTSALVDRAYSGKTGNKADVLLGNLFGLNTRVGLADTIHCCATAANVVWSDKRRNAQGKAKAESNHLGGSAQSGSAAGSAEAGLRRSC
jgi:hypothetical protein